MVEQELKTCTGQTGLGRILGGCWIHRGSGWFEVSKNEETFCDKEDRNCFLDKKLGVWSQSNEGVLFERKL